MDFIPWKKYEGRGLFTKGDKILLCDEDEIIAEALITKFAPNDNDPIEIKTATEATFHTVIEFGKWVEKVILAPKNRTMPIGGIIRHLFVAPSGMQTVRPKRDLATTTCVIRIAGPKDIPMKTLPEWNKRRNFVNCTSRSTAKWSRGLSPFYLGPVELPSGDTAQVMENAWQFTKVFDGYTDPVTGDPTNDYWDWARKGWTTDEPIRYPMGKRGVKPLYCWWKGQRLGYIDSRKQIYCPSYAACVENTEAFAKLRDLYETETEIVLWDFDGYDHLKVRKSLKQCLNDPSVIMGHAFVLAMLLTNQRHWLDQD